MYSDFISDSEWDDTPVTSLQGINLESLNLVPISEPEDSVEESVETPAASITQTGLQAVNSRSGGEIAFKVMMNRLAQKYGKKLSENGITLEVDLESASVSADLSKLEKIIACFLTELSSIESLNVYLVGRQLKNTYSLSVSGFAASGAARARNLSSRLVDQAADSGMTIALNKSCNKILYQITCNSLTVA